MWKKSKEEINDMCNSGMFNDIIKGYCIIVCKELGVQDEIINDYSFNRLFDFVGAEQARKQSEKLEFFDLRKKNKKRRRID